MTGYMGLQTGLQKEQTMETDINDVTSRCANCNFPNILRQWESRNQFHYYCHACGAYNRCKSHIDYTTGKWYWTSTHVPSPMGPDPTTSTMRQSVPSESASDDLRADPDSSSVSYWSEVRYGPTREMHSGYSDGFKAGRRAGYTDGYKTGRANAGFYENYDEGYRAGLEFALGHLTLASDRIKAQIKASE